MRRLVTTLILIGAIATASACGGDDTPPNATPGASATTASGASPTADATPPAGATPPPGGATSPGGQPPAPGATTPPAGPPPTGNVAANTEAVCTRAEGVITAESARAYALQIGLMINARTSQDRAAETAAKAAAKVQVDGWAKSLRDIATTATDPNVKAALNDAAGKIAMLGSDQYLATINSIADAAKIDQDIAVIGTTLQAICG